MLLLTPLTLTPAMLTASNAGAADTDYSPATLYALNERVFVPEDGYTYECVQAPAEGQYPPTSPLYWMRAAPSNRWAMFDAEISTATTRAGNIAVTLALSERINAISLHGLVGTSATVVHKDGSTVLGTYTTSLVSDPADWYDYYFGPYRQRREWVVTGLAPYVNSTLEITIAGTSTACAACLVGTASEIGSAQYGFSTGIIDYSSKQTSATGVQTLKKGKYAKRMSGSLEVPRAQYSAVTELLESVRGTPCAWIGVPDNADYTPMTILGFYRDFQIEIPGPSVHVCSLEVEGLT